MNMKKFSMGLAIMMGINALVPLYAATVDQARYEAEQATLHNVGLGDNSYKGYSGSGYVAGMDASDAYIEFTVNVPKAGRYNLYVNYCAPYGEKQETITVNGGQSFSGHFTPNTAFELANVGTIKLNAGENKIRISRFWGWTLFDYIELEEAEAISINTNVSDELINPNATEATKKLMTYLTSIYGKNILSGQFAYTTKYTEIDAIYNQTKKYPAIIGLDFSDYSPARVALGCNKGQDTEKAIEWWKQGGLVTFCWHWHSPIGASTDEDKKWGGFYTKNTTYDLGKAMSDHNSEEYITLIRDIDAIAVELSKLQDANVPILWRPLHEASGGWFWWGAAGADNYKELWKLMYDRLTNYHGINNLIWVWNAQEKDWYPGDEYVDIIGEDIYANKKDYDSQSNGFLKAYDYTKTNKIITMSENGVLMDPDILVADGIPWSWNCTWGGEFVVPWVGSYDYTEQYTSLDMLKKYYNHSYVLTRDELPTYLFTSSDVKEMKVSVTTPSTGEVFDCSTSYSPIALAAAVENANTYTVEFFVNGTSVGKGNEVSFLPSGTTTNADGLVEYTIVAKVTDSTGKTKTSEPVTIQVKLPIVEKMAVSIVSPQSGEVFDCSVPGTNIPLSAELKNEETASIAFYVDDKLIGTGKDVNWVPTDTVSSADELKTYYVVAKATNVKGEVAVSEKIAIQVKLPVKEVTQTVKVIQNKTAPIGNSINMNLEVTNTGEEMDLSQLELRYYFTEQTTLTQTIWCDHSALQMNVSPWYVTLNSDLEKEIVNLGNGEFYISIKPTSRIPFVNNGKFILQARVTKSDWSNYDQSNDLSYNNGIAVYYKGALIEGMEP